MDTFKDMMYFRGATYIPSWAGGWMFLQINNLISSLVKKYCFDIEFRPNMHPAFMVNSYYTKYE